MLSVTPVHLTFIQNCISIEEVQAIKVIWNNLKYNCFSDYYIFFFIYIYSFWKANSRIWPLWKQHFMQTSRHWWLNVFPNWWHLKWNADPLPQISWSQIIMSFPILRVTFQLVHVSTLYILACLTSPISPSFLFSLSLHVSWYCMCPTCN